MNSIRRRIVDVAAVAALLLVTVIGFWPTFGGPGYLLPALGGLSLGLGIAVVAARLRWGVLLTTAAAIVAYFVLGSALAVPYSAIIGVIPSLDSLQQLAAGVVTSWKALVTTVAPVSVADGFGIVPFLLLLIAAVLTGSLALRLRHPAWALLPAGAALLVQIALGTSTPAAPIVQGVVFAVTAVVWLALRQAWAPAQTVVSLGETGQATRAGTRRRVALGAGIIAVAVAAGAVTGAVAAPVSPRYVVRDVVIPPFDIHDYASPLQSFRAIVRDDRQTTLFTVQALPHNARVRLAVMDAYSGVVYNVSDAGFGSSSAFSPVRANMSPDAKGTPATVHIQMGALDGVWMPSVGAVQSMVFDGPRADDLRRAALYNEATSSALVTAGLTKGDGYELNTVVAARPSDKALAKVPVAPVRMPRQQGVPQEVAAVAAKATADARTPIEQVRALEKYLADGGFFSHGLENEPRSLAGHGAARISALLQSRQMVGDDEQYATAMALMAGALGIPARVVMGFYPAEDEASGSVFSATGDDLHAWVEVPFTGVGWVAFDPTPPKDHVPTDQTTKPQTKPKPQVLQPPPPAQQPADEPPTVPADHGKKDDKNPAGAILLAVLAAVGVSAGAVGVVAAPFLVIGALKSSRRRRRRTAERPADRISGGWDELKDAALDYGTPVRAGATRSEDARVVAAAFDRPAVTALAQHADARVWAPGEPTDAEVDEFWSHVDGIVDEVGAERGFWRRTRARFTVRSLVAGTALERWMPRIGRRRAGDAGAHQGGRSGHGVGSRHNGNGHDDRAGSGAGRHEEGA
ncbi:transglutaminase-like domain-containing protein [Microbacterium luticocti]|uniref:transglutaminase-like domain-containing protein n=1 Tax=Microbacterium luticocti TaxID=451764 RepID=UPI000410F166|nr:transglutaminase-like domain-containing protein [Microbacterium luticocti]